MPTVTDMLEDLRSDLPREWSCCRLVEVASLGSGTTPPRSRESLYYAGGKISWVKTGDLNNYEIYSTEESITQFAIEQCNCRVYGAGTVLLAMYGGFNQIGRTGILRIPAAINQAITAISPHVATLMPEFLIEWLNYTVPYWRRVAASSRKDPNITKGDIAELPIVIPPVSEQNRIVSVGATWVQAIRQVERLIVAKDRLFRGLNEKLLTNEGHARTHDSGEWRSYRLGELFAERNETGWIDHPLLSITADRGLVPREEVDRKDSSSGDKSFYKRIVPGDLGYNTMRMWQGVSALADREGIVSPAYTICTPTPLIDSRFAAFLFKVPSMINLFYRYSQGLVDDTLSLKFDSFAQIQIAVPSIVEQRRVAFVLETAAAELRLLRRYVWALRSERSALMTKLLGARASRRVFAEAGASS